MELTGQQTGIVTVVYVSALLPWLLIVPGYFMGRVPRWIVVLLGAGFVACAIGWEIWLTYGLVDGLSVIDRRPDAMNAAIPLHLNWVLNSMADAGSIGLLGAWLVWLVYGRSATALRRWHWGAFFVLLTWFIAQNLWVELRVYQAQLAEGLHGGMECLGLGRPPPAHEPSDGQADRNQRPQQEQWQRQCRQPARPRDADECEGRHHGCNLSSASSTVISPRAS